MPWGVRCVHYPANDVVRAWFCRASGNLPHPRALESGLGESKMALKISPSSSSLVFSSCVISQFSSRSYPYRELRSSYALVLYCLYCFCCSYPSTVTRSLCVPIGGMLLSTLLDLALCASSGLMKRF
jgi:hypothetical protein